MAVGSIGRWQGAGLLATTLLGTGVFILPGLTLASAGGAAVWVWVGLTLLAMPVTYVFAALAGQFPHAEGPAYFALRAFGPVAGRVIGLMFLLVVPVGAAAALSMAWSFVQPWFFQSHWLNIAAQLSFLLLFYLLNRIGFQLSARLQLALTLAIVAAVLGLLLWALPQLSATLPALPFAAASADAVSGIQLAFALGFWSFLGVEAMTHLAQDFKNPAKDMVPALITGLSLVGCIYLLTTWLIWQLSPSATEPLSMVQLASQLLGASGGPMIAWLGLASSLAGVNVYTASVARLCGSFAEQGVLPARLAKKNVHQVPEAALLLMLGLMALVICGSTFTGQALGQLIGWVNGVFVTIYLAAMASALVLLSGKLRWFAGVSLLLCGLIAWSLAGQMLYAGLLVCLCVPWLCWQQRRGTALGNNQLRVTD